MVTRLTLKGIDKRAPPREPNLTQQLSVVKDHTVEIDSEAILSLYT
jgi:hypothetical protein